MVEEADDIVGRGGGPSEDAPGDRTREPMTALEPPLPAEVERLLADVAGHDASDISIDVEKLGREHTVYRVRVVTNGEPSSVIVKRVDPQVAERNRLVAHRWLPWLGLEGVAPKLLGAAASPGVEAVWQIYEDVRGATLQEHRSDRDLVAATVEQIAELHTRAAEHPVVTECRRAGQDLGMHFFTTNVSDASRLLEALRPPRVQVSGDDAGVRDRLRWRLERLLDDMPRRARLMEEAGGPETMLHGDLWTTNVIVEPTGDRHVVRLVDWDRAGAGHFCYDLSILLYRFAARDRPWILDRYRDAVGRAGWRLAPAPALDVLFGTFECARYANRIVWPALALLRDDAAWGWRELATIEGWFRALEPFIQE